MQDQQAVNLLKGLVIDGVANANSGHPGGPMSSMDLTYILYTEFLKFDPDDPRWQGRDRFILSAGHMSMLLYSMLYGTGWLEIDDLKQFRQLHSKTPGHPENFQTPGVECTTGPLGQGAAMSVGFAIANQHLRAKLDKELFDSKTWAIVSDGDLQEGVALGAASLAGHLALDNLIWVFDKNHIQLSGPTAETISDDEEKLFTGLGWHTIKINGHNHEEIRAAYKAASEVQGKPTIVIAETIIGKGCVSMENSSKTHGSPLPEDEKNQTKKAFGIPEGESFYAPAELRTHFQRNFRALRDQVSGWKKRHNDKMSDASFSKDWNNAFAKVASSDVPTYNWDRTKPQATRNSFGELIEAWAEHLPQLFGGSADLAPSNMTQAFAKKVGDFDSKNRLGRNLNFGVREFPMSAICNGMALHGGVIPFDATFLSFADYSRGALRLGALQKVRVIHEFTHDSFYLGEDGPTHQPVEQVMSLRTIPDFYVMRPADPQETEHMLRKSITLDLPSALCLTRQKVPFLELTAEMTSNIEKGAYVVKEAKDPEYIIFASGSEVGLALAAAEQIGAPTRVVSVPCWELFSQQDKSYQASVLHWPCKQRISIEAGTTLGWERFVGASGLKIGVDHFGASAPAEVLAKEYGFTPEQVCEKIKNHSFDN